MQPVREFREPTAKLISFTSNPIETIYCCWQHSKLADFDKTPDQIRALMLEDSDEGRRTKADVMEVFAGVVGQAIPVAESISFTFVLTNDPIAHREQMVRHRIGVSFGDNFGVDIAPELAKSTWWSQTMRVLPFDNVYDEERYFVPLMIRGNDLALQSYDETMKLIQAGYRQLVQLGVPLEDARCVLPLASTMDITWTLNLSALMHILGKRSCWILQYGFWSFFIRDMIEELCNKIDPIFRDIILPPCFTGKYGQKKFNGQACNLHYENERRMSGDDVEVPCTLFTNNVANASARAAYEKAFPEKVVEQGARAPRYLKLWGRSAFTGEVA